MIGEEPYGLKRKPEPAIQDIENAIAEIRFTKSTHGLPLLYELPTERSKPEAIGKPLPIYFAPKDSDLNQPEQLTVYRKLGEHSFAVLIADAGCASNRAKCNTVIEHDHVELEPKGSTTNGARSSIKGFLRMAKSRVRCRWGHQ